MSFSGFYVPEIEEQAFMVEIFDKYKDVAIDCYHISQDDEENTKQRIGERLAEEGDEGEDAARLVGIANGIDITDEEAIEARENAID